MSPSDSALRARHAALCEAIRDEAARLRRASPHAPETGCRLARLDVLEDEMDAIGITLALRAFAPTQQGEPR